MEGSFSDPVEQFHQEANVPQAAAPAPDIIARNQQALAKFKMASNTRNMQMRAQEIHPSNPDQPSPPMMRRAPKAYFNPRLDSEHPSQATQVTLQGKFSDIVGAPKHTGDLVLPITHRDVMYRYVNDNTTIDPKEVGFDGTGAPGVGAGQLNTFFDGKSVWMSRTKEGAENFAREHAPVYESHRVKGTIYKINTKGIPLIDVESLSKDNPELYHAALSSSQGRHELDFTADSPEAKEAYRARSDAYQKVVALNQEHVAMGPIPPDRILETTRTNMDKREEWDPAINEKTRKVQDAMRPFAKAAKDMEVRIKPARVRFQKQIRQAFLHRQHWIDSKAKGN